MDHYPPSTATAVGMGGNSADGVAVQAIHSAGLTRVVHAPCPIDRVRAIERLFTGGDDYLVRILPSQRDSPMEPLVIDDATKAITWIDADADYLVTGSEDGCVRIYQHSQPTSDLESQMTSPTDLVCLLARTSLSIRCVVLERAVSMGKTPRVAVCSDELVVKVIDVGDPKRVQLLTGHSRGLQAASWHPLRSLLATTSCDGTLKVWDLSTTEPECVKTLDSILPAASSHSEHSSQVLYHPSGEYIVFPSKTHELVAIGTVDYRRVGSYVVRPNSQVPMPTGEVTSFAFSPNGRYLASATTDGRVTIWDSETRDAICSLSRHSMKTGLSWDPKRNTLAWTDTMGQLSRWTDVVDSTYPSPCEHVEYLSSSQSKRRKAREEVDDLFGDVGLEEEEDVPIELTHKSHDEYRSAFPNRREPQQVYTFARAQASFQPTSTPMRGGRRFMCLNMIGSLTAIDQGAQQSISFDSHDANARRNWRIADHFGYNMAAMGPAGVLFACPSKLGSSNNDNSDDETDEERDDEERTTKKGHPSTITFKPFEAMGAWAVSGSEWSIALGKGEEAVAVAIGGRRAHRESNGADNVTAVVATSAGYLRFFSGSGMQRYIWAFGEKVVSMAASNRLLFIVHASSGESLGYTVIDLLSLSITQEGALPLPQSTLATWIGFNELDFPAIFDSRQVLYILDRCFGSTGQARWTPILDANSAGIESHSEGGGARLNFWPVGLSSSSLLTVFLKGTGLAYPDPSAESRPLIQEVTLKMPLLNMDNPMGSLEEQYLRNIQLASFIRSFKSSLRDTIDDDLEETVSELSAPNTLEHEADKALLQLIQQSCKADKHQKVLDAARELHNTRTLDAALQIGAFFHLSSLVDRMGSLRDWVSSRKERDEQIAVGDLPLPSKTSELHERRVGGTRILVGSSQSPSLHHYDAAGEDSRTKKAALGSDFAARPRKSYGEGGKSDLAKLGHRSPTSTWASDAMSMDGQKQSEKENDIRGQKRGADERDDEERGITISDEQEANVRRLTANPFANKSNTVTSSKNPFARTAGMTRDRSMHKSSSFFDRVDASMESAREGKTKSAKVKQSTLFDLAKSKDSSSSIRASESRQESFMSNANPPENEEDEESLRLTLSAAAQRDEGSLQLEATQVADNEDSQFDSLPMDVTV